MSLHLEPLPLDGCLRLDMPLALDARGSFCKPYQRSAFAARRLPTDFSEQFFSRSSMGVVRGLHLQLPPFDQWKLVVCLSGQVQDVLLDVRADAPSYGRHVTVILRADDGVGVLMPPGVAHGFLSLAENTLMAYWVTAEYNAAADTGVRWDSAGIEWAWTGTPTVSDRDGGLPTFADFAWPGATARPGA